MVELDGLQLFSKPVKSRKRRATEAPGQSGNDPQQDELATSSRHPLPDGLLPEPKQAEGQLASPETILADKPTFSSLGLSEWLQRLCKSLGMLQPTEVQTGCIPSILAGRDVIGTAHTGSGKTAAFALPILQQLAQDPFGVYALVLTPTRSAGSAATMCCCECLLNNFEPSHSLQLRLHADQRVMCTVFVKLQAA